MNISGSKKLEDGEMVLLSEKHGILQNLHSGFVTGFTFDPDEFVLITYGEDKKIIYIDFVNEQILYKFENSVQHK